MRRAAVLLLQIGLMLGPLGARAEQWAERWPEQPAEQRADVQPRNAQLMDLQAETAVCVEAVPGEDALRAAALPTITNATMTKALPSPLCDSLPVPTTSFLTTDPSAYLYLRASTITQGEVFTVVWYGPSGAVYTSSSTNPLIGGATYCFGFSISIAGKTPATMPGTWRVQLFSSLVTDVPYVNLTFTITSGGGGGGGGGLPTITNQMMTKAVPSPLCSSVPTATTSFSATDSNAYLYFRISGQAQGEVLTAVWYEPSGAVYASGPWSALNSGSTYCLAASIVIAGQSAASKPGTWHVQVFSDKVTDVPYVDLTFSIGSGGGGGGGSSKWILPSSAHVQTGNAFWRTDLYIRNAGSQTASATIKFLGHGNDGTAGPETVVSIPAGATLGWSDALAALFATSTNEWGPLLVTSSSASLAVIGQTWTPGGGGTFGQSVPAIGPSDLVGGTAHSMPGIRQDGTGRTGIYLANATATSTDVDVSIVSGAGVTLGQRRVTLGPYGFWQGSVQGDFGLNGISGASVVVSSPTSGAAFGAYASIIDQVTQDPRTVVAQ